MAKLGKETLHWTSNALQILGHEIMRGDGKILYKGPGMEAFVETAGFTPPFDTDMITMYEQARSIPRRIVRMVAHPMAALSLFMDGKLREDVLHTAQWLKTEDGMDGILLPRIRLLNQEYFDVLIRAEDGTGWVDPHGEFHKLERPSIERLPG